MVFRYKFLNSHLYLYAYPEINELIHTSTSPTTLSLSIFTVLAEEEREMAFSRFLGCFLCEKDKKDGEVDTIPAIPVQYAIEGKDVQLSANSDSSFDSEAEFTKDEKLPALQDAPRIPELPSSTKTNRQLVVAAKGMYASVESPFPVLANSREVVIRNLATGLNPIDFKSVDYNFCLPEFPWVTGREMAGIVEVVGDDVTEFKVGDKVWTSEFSLPTVPIYF